MGAEATSPPTGQRPGAVEEIIASLRSGDVATARRLAGAALDAGLEHPLLLNLRALDHEENGRLESALADLRRAHVLAPRDFAVLNACGLCLARMQRLDEAAQCYEQALGLQPAFGPAWFNLGWTFEQLGETARAAEAYGKAAALNPENAQAWANVAWLAARRGDAEAARANAEKALVAQPGHPTAILALASVELTDPPAAERRLRDLLAEPQLGAYDRGLALGQLGDVLDARDRPNQAFGAYAASNALFRDEARARFEAKGQETVADTLAWLTAWAGRLDRAQWARPAGASSPGEVAGEAGHVFLIGFPRSGTTLMENVLGAHPDVVSLEERNTLSAAVRAFMADGAALARLAASPEHELRFYRDDYWKSVSGFGVETAGKIFIDKNPFNTVKLPLIYKLFPDAKVIFAVRDPRDVVLSCFRRRFNLNPSTYELLDLKRAATFYDRTMTFAETLRPKQDLAEHRLVYERLVEDFAAEARRACAFIGAEWRDDLLDFSARARRGEVASASSAQISRGLYADGAGQWRPYREALAPVMDLLAPWVERFGYPAT